MLCISGTDCGICNPLLGFYTGAEAMAWLNSAIGTEMNQIKVVLIRADPAS